MIPELTVLIPTRNRPGLLKYALESVRQSLGANTKVIIGDNGDGASTFNVLENNGFFDLSIELVVNESGSSYTDNIHKLISSCQTQWLTVLHDDDFFVGDIQAHISAAMRQHGIVFIFSDHWIAKNDGTLDETLTVKNSQLYGRDKLNPGVVFDLGLLAIQNSICLDGFFVKTDVAKRHCLDISLPVYAQNRWMIELCLECVRGIYIKERLFAYRLTSNSLTAQGMDRIEILASLSGVKMSSGPFKNALDSRVKSAWWSASKAAVRGCDINFFMKYPPWQFIF